MSDSEPSLGEQMTAGLEKIRHQIELLRDGPTIGEALDDRGVIAGLEAEYQALKAARAGLGPEDR
jgi:hypothetical protein